MYEPTLWSIASPRIVLWSAIAGKHFYQKHEPKPANCKSIGIQVSALQWTQLRGLSGLFIMDACTLNVYHCCYCLCCCCCLHHMFSCVLFLLPVFFVEILGLFFAIRQICLPVVWRVDCILVIVCWS